MLGPPDAFQFNSRMAPDTDFEVGQLQHLVPKNGMSRTIALFRQTVPLPRLFMTYLETRQFNYPFKEAEAILIADPGNLAF